MSEKLRRLSIFDYLLVLLCILHFILNLVWYYLNTAPLPWDQAGHTRLAIQFSDLFKSFGFINIGEYLTLSNYYPPLLYTIAGFAILIFGSPVLTSEIIINIFFVGLIVLLYVYTLDLFRNKPIAFLTCLIFSFIPIIYEHGHWFMLEIPLLFFFLASLICLRRSALLTKPNYTYGFFILFAFAVITKWLNFVYISIPLLLTLIDWIKLKPEVRKHSFPYILEGVILFIAISIPWYIANLNLFLKSGSISITAEATNPQNLMSVKNLLFYFYLFITFQTTIYIAILFLIGTIVYALSKLENKRFIFIMLTSIYLIFTVIPNKNSRYIISLLPFVSMIIAIALLKLYNHIKYLGIIVTAIVIVYLVGLYSLLSFRFPVNFTYQKAVNLPIIGWIDYVNINDNLAHSYNKEVWPQKKLISDINNRSGGRNVKVINLVDIERMNAINAALEEDLLADSKIVFMPPGLFPFKNPVDIAPFLHSFQYAVLAKNKVGVAATRNIKAFDQLRNFILEHPKMPSEIIYSYTMPNGDTLLVYKIPASF